MEMKLKFILAIVVLGVGCSVAEAAKEKSVFRHQVGSMSTDDESKSGWPRNASYKVEMERAPSTFVVDIGGCATLQVKTGDITFSSPFAGSAIKEDAVPVNDAGKYIIVINKSPLGDKLEAYVHYYHQKDWKTTNLVLDNIEDRDGLDSCVVYDVNLSETVSGGKNGFSGVSMAATVNALSKL